MESHALPGLAERLLSDARSSHAGRAALTLHGGHDHRLRQTLVALASGRQLADHGSPEEGTLQVLVGAVDLVAGDDVWHGRVGDLLVLPAARHSLQASQDAAVLLTVSMRLGDD